MITKEKEARNLRENKRAHDKVWREEREGENYVIRLQFLNI